MIHHAVERARGWLGFVVVASSNQMRTSSRPDPVRRLVSTHHASATSGHKSRPRLPSSNRAISILQLWCILNVCMSMLDLSQLLGPRRATWPRKRRKQRRQRRQPRRKRSNRSTKIHRIRIAPEIRCTLRSTDSSIFRRQNIRATNSQAGPLCRWLLHNGPGFRWDLTKRSMLHCLPKLST